MDQWQTDYELADNTYEEEEVRACMIIMGEPPGHTPHVAGDGLGRAALAQRDKCSNCMIDIMNDFAGTNITCCTAGCEVFEDVAKARKEGYSDQLNAMIEDQNDHADTLIDPCKHCPARGGWNPTTRMHKQPTCSGVISDKYTNLFK